MFNYKNAVFILMISIGFVSLSCDKAMASYEKNMLEFVSPAELGVSPENEKKKTDLKKTCEENDIACKVTAKPLELSKPVKNMLPPKALQKVEQKAQKPDSSMPTLVKQLSPPQTEKNIMASYKLGSGDKIKITVFDERELSNIYLVNEEGFISVPLIGAVHVLNKTIQDVKIIMHEKLSDGYLIDPSIAIEVDEFRPIYVMGEVRNPGKFAFMTDMTVRNAVAIAGGFTYRAKQDSVRILRGINKNSIHEIEGVKPDSKIKPGDTILIKERFF